MRLGYFGPEGTYTQEALLADAAGLDAARPSPLPTIYDTVMAVHDGTVDRALVPIENSLEGSVNATLDALAMETEDVMIVGEVVHPIRHCLIARTELELSDDRDRRLAPAGQRPVRPVHPHPAAGRPGHGRQLDRRGGAHRRRPRRPLGGARQPAGRRALRLHRPAGRGRGRRRTTRPASSGWRRSGSPTGGPGRPPAPTPSAGRGRPRSCSGGGLRGAGLAGRLPVASSPQRGVNLTRIESRPRQTGPRAATCSSSISRGATTIRTSPQAWPGCAAKSRRCACSARSRPRPVDAPPAA